MCRISTTVYKEFCREGPWQERAGVGVGVSDGGGGEVADGAVHGNGPLARTLPRHLRLQSRMLRPC